MPTTIYTDDSTPIFPIKYYVATETGYLDNLNYSVSRLINPEPSTNAALLLGNSYILATIALLPDPLTTLYHCDSDPCILDYAQQWIRIANSSNNYLEFRQQGYALLDSNYSFVTIRVSRYYNNDKDNFIAERILSEELFYAYKNKINNISIHYCVIDILNRRQVGLLSEQITQNRHKIGLFSISNILQFDVHNVLSTNFFKLLCENEASSRDAAVLYSWYIPPEPGGEPRPTSKFLQDPLNLERINEFHGHLNTLKEKIYNLKHRGYLVQAIILDKLYEELFLLSTQVDDISLFSKEASKKITTVKFNPEICTHRGCALIIADILSTLIQLCSFGLAYHLTGRFFLFSPLTDSVSKLQNFSDSLADYNSDSIPNAPDIAVN